MAAEKKAQEPTETKEAKAPKRKKLEELFNEPCTIVIERAMMHQSFQVPGAGQEVTMSASRPGTKELKMVYHPGYGLIGYHKGKYFLTPSANMVVAHETENK